MEDQNRLIKIRKEKLDELRQSGVDPYPREFKQSHFSLDIIENYQEMEGNEVSVSGRIMAVRLMGKDAFVHLQDKSGRIQLFIRKDDIGEENYKIFKSCDIGDFIGVSGTVFKTRTGEISVQGFSFQLLSKSIRPLPIVKEEVSETGEKIVHDAFADQELRYRQRYVDLIVNPEVKDVFIKRSKIIQGMRNFLNHNDFLEVETPI